MVLVATPVSSALDPFVPASSILARQRHPSQTSLIYNSCFLTSSRHTTTICGRAFSRTANKAKKPSYEGEQVDSTACLDTHVREYASSDLWAFLLNTYDKGGPSRPRPNQDGNLVGEQPSEPLSILSEVIRSSSFFQVEFSLSRWPGVSIRVKIDSGLART